MSGATLINRNGPALHGDGLHVDNGLFLKTPSCATGSGEYGTVRLLGARIGGQLNMSGANLINYNGPALAGDALHVDGALLLGERFRATGDDEDGSVKLRSAHIAGDANLSGANLINKNGPALNCQGLQVDGALFLQNNFCATGRGRSGTVRLAWAHIGGQMNLSGAQLTNQDGPALFGDGLQVDASLFLRSRFRATGGGEFGVVRLPGARIGGRLHLGDAELPDQNGVILNLEDAEAKYVFIPPQVVCPHGVAGRSTCDAAARRVDLSGFVYTSLEDSHWDQWLHVIARHTSKYRPQPYQQLAAGGRAAGHDGDARKILIAQQQDLGERGEPGGWWTKNVHRGWGVLGRYGYRTGRIAVALLIALLAAAGLGIVAGHIPTSPGRYVAMHTAQSDNPHGPCSLTEQIGVGIDRGLPLGTTGIRGHCDFDTASRRGQVVTWVTWALQALV